jgi:hypothetical protein
LTVGSRHVAVFWIVFLTVCFAWCSRRLIYGAVHRMTAAQSKAVGHNTNPKDSKVPKTAIQYTARWPALWPGVGLPRVEDETLTD